MPARFHPPFAALAVCLGFLPAGAFSADVAQWPAVADMPAMPAIASETAPGFPGLPDPLRFFDHAAGDAYGPAVADSLEWRFFRRPEILAMFRHYLYGHEPPPPPDIQFSLQSEDTAFMGGLATRKEIRATFQPMGGPGSIACDFVLYLPNAAGNPPPVIVSLNNADPAEIEPGGSVDHRWDLTGTLASGIALLVANQSEFSGDSHGSWRQPLVDAYAAAGFDGDWQTLSAWAWGLSRMVDYIETDPALDRHRIALTGFSRRGKAAKWAGILDERVALVAPHQGGFAGGSPIRPDWGIGTGYLNSFQYWFLPAFIDVPLSDYDRLPFDGNTALAAIAPRRIYLSQNSSYGASETGIRGLVQATRPAWDFLGMDGTSEVTYWYDPDSTHQFEPYHWERIYAAVHGLPTGGLRAVREWLSGHGIEPGDDPALAEALAADTDRDGRSALEEFLFQTDPAVAETHPPLRLAASPGGGLVISFLQRRDGVGQPGSGYRWRGVVQFIEWAPSPNGPWTPVSADRLIPVSVSPGPDASSEIIHLRDPLPDPGNPIFYRLSCRI